MEGAGLDGGGTSSLLGGVAGCGEDASARFGRRRRPISLMADIGRGRFMICSRAALPVLAGSGGDAVAVPVGGDRILVCAVGFFACVSCTVISDEFEINEALVSALNAFSAASRSAFCCRRILSTNGERQASQPLEKRTRSGNKEAPLYPRRLRAFRSVERIVMNNRASLTLGDSKMRRHNEIETLRVVKQ